MSSEVNPPREATLSVLKDNGNKVIITINVPGLKRRRSFFKAILNLFSKPSNPFRLSSNAHFANYSLTNGSLDFSVDVYENKQALREHSELRQTYFCKIDQFPSRINPESAEFEVCFPFLPSPRVLYTKHFVNKIKAFYAFEQPALV